MSVFCVRNYVDMVTADSFFLFSVSAFGETLVRFDTQAYGLTCVISGFLIGFKQLVPDHSITLWKVVSVRVKVNYLSVAFHDV